MRSSQPGRPTSAEVSHISPFGVWVLVNGVEYFLDYEKFPWFRGATVSQIHALERYHGHHLRWPDLDIALDLERMAQPERFPLVSRVRKPRRAAG